MKGARANSGAHAHQPDFEAKPPSNGATNRKAHARLPAVEAKQASNSAAKERRLPRTGYGPRVMQPERRHLDSTCSATIVMTENRPLRPSAYWTKAIELNQLFAARHHHSFVLVRPPVNSTKRSDVLWCKVPAMLSVIQPILAKARASSAPSASSCAWVVFLDSDAFVRDHSLSLHEMLLAHGVDAATHLVVSQEV